MPRPYRDRSHAGEVLATLLAGYADRGDVTVLALPRGGVPVAYPIAQAVNGPLDVLEVRKLGVPGHEELAMGAVAAGGVLVLNPEVVSALAIDRTTLDVAIAAARLRLADQHRRFRGDHPPAPREGRQVVLVDDGLATGATMEAAIGSCRLAGVAGIVVAVPVGAPATVARMASLADRVFCPLTPPDFRAVGLAYRDFSPVDEQVVVALLDAARGGRARP